MMAMTPSVPESPAPAAFSVSDVHRLLDEAVRAAGLVNMWVTGTVTGLRPGPKFTTFELVDYEDDGATVRAVLAVGVFARYAREIRKTLAVAGAEPVDGLEVSVWGPRRRGAQVYSATASTTVAATSGSWPHGSGPSPWARTAPPCTDPT